MDGVNEDVEQFVADLAAATAGSLFNQYSREVPGLDRPGAAAIRRENLMAYLESRIGAFLALIGEAPSAHGARFSGIAFTSERLLDADRHTSALGLRPSGFAELSATVLRNAIRDAGLDEKEIVLWNVVPFHPAPPNQPLRNRPPTATELATGREWLNRFIRLMGPHTIVAVGQTARRSLPPGTTVVRHPANGGYPQLSADLLALREGMTWVVPGEARAG